MSRLQIEDAAGVVRVEPFDDIEISLGRAPDNGVVLAERNVSRHHARLRQSAGRYWLADAGARYGLRVNGTIVRGEVEVKPGEPFAIGDFRIRVLPADASEDALAAPLPAPRPTSEVSDFDLFPAVGELRDMERIAELGWVSDFDLEDDSRRLTPGRLALLVLLAAAAIGLGVLYYMTMAEPDAVPGPRGAIPSWVARLDTPSNPPGGEGH